MDSAQFIQTLFASHRIAIFTSPANWYSSAAKAEQELFCWSVVGERRVLDTPLLNPFGVDIFYLF